jgi:ATP-dependent DNA helicase DinG
MPAGDDGAVAALRSVVSDLGGDTRTGQEIMAAAIENAIREETPLVIQAGTGTGKSLGYLVPAVLAAREHGKRVVIATSTLGLQRQLSERDLPRVLASLGVEDRVHAAVLKGRQNYVCLNRMRAEVPDDDDALFGIDTGRLGQQVRDLRAWAETTTSGDRDDFPGDVDVRVWRSLSVTARECIGEAKCTYAAECFSAHRRMEAMSADIVITNHALVAINTTGESQVLPAHDVLILDEAHDFVDRVTSAVTVELQTAAVRRLLARLGSRVAAEIRGHAEEALVALEAACAGLDGGRIRELPADLILALTLMRDAGHAILSNLAAEDALGSLDDSRLRAGVEEIHEASARVLGRRDDDVMWIDQAAGDFTLHVVPLDIGDVVREALPAVTIATSATLVIGGDPDRTVASLGLAEGTAVIDVGSPFDFTQQGILYIASHLPQPDRDGIAMEALDELAFLIEAAGGRTLGLFSSWRGVERASEYLRVRLPEMRLLAQQRGESPARMIEEFSRDETSVLLGTVSLWQGIDVPGRSCILVTIDRLPFPRPDDPLLGARAERAEEMGGSGFMEVSVPRAALLLAQGAGRLIRGHDDRGVVAVLDSRLASARYAKTIRQTMPPLWTTSDRDIVLAALQRLAG